MKSGLERLLADGHPWVDAKNVGLVGPRSVSSALTEAGIRCAEPGAPEADTLLVDLPASGSRLTGEHLVLVDVLAQSAAHGRRVLVLDRPVPLGGVQLEGPAVELVSEALGRPVSLPLRHGLTLGELARWIASMGVLRVDLEVIPCTGWDRLLGPHPPAGFPQPAWHIPELFCGLGLVAAAARCEWTTVCDERVALSWPDTAGARLLELVRMGAMDADLHGVDFHAHPNGLGVRLTDPHSVDAVSMGLVVLEALCREHEARSPRAFWMSEDGSPCIDRASGSAEIRLALSARIRPTELTEAWAPALAQFDEDRQAVQLYR